jgi:alpha/beta superfamily hydrolase
MSQMEGFRSRVVAVEDLRGPAGKLEALLNTGKPDARYAAVVAHPHPPSGGTMHTKVVYHAAKAFSSFGMPVLRFNFRGVGLSEGVYDNGPGEIEDVKAAVNWLDAGFRLPVVVAGFSFGANVGLRAGCGDARVKGLVGLGLPVQAGGRSYTYEFLPECGSVPKLFVIGDHDPFAPKEVLERVLETAPEPKKLVWVPDADHFFAWAVNRGDQSPASKLDAMSGEIRSWVAESFGL